MKKIPMSESVGLLRLTLIVCALVAQLVVLALFIVFAIAAAIRFRPAPAGMLD